MSADEFGLLIRNVLRVGEKVSALLQADSKSSRKAGLFKFKSCGNFAKSKICTYYHEAGNGRLIVLM